MKGNNLIQDRIEKLMVATKHNKLSFSKKIGTSDAVVGNIVGGRRSNPSYELIEKILLAFDNLNVGWLITGKGDMFGDEVKNPNEYLTTIMRQAEEIGSLKKELEFYKGSGGRIYAIKERVRRLEISVKYILDFIGDEKSFRKALKFIDQPLSKVAVSIANAKGEVEFVNLEFTNMTGYTIDEMFGKKAGDLLQGEDTEKKVVKEMGDAIKNKKWFEGEVINYNKNGEKIVCKLIIAPMLDRKDNLDKIISLATFYK